VLGYVKGGAKGDVLLTFVIHEHEALRAGWHHDLRLERNGVLKSWAVPKGVPEESRVRRIAIPVEDHVLSYGKFKGKIPEGQYGAGEVRIWDRGTYEVKSWSDTKIEVTFHGKRLSGDYILRWMEAMNRWLLWKR
jgi:bifunctional non-homologous end joining protein LigD